MKYTYKDIATGGIKWTRGRFVKWTQPTGLLNARYAVFQLPKSVVLVPEYCLTKDTRNQLPKE